MKKLVFSISLILSYTFIAIAGVVKSIPAKADEFTNGNIITVTPSISETDLTTYNNALQVLEYLRQGGTIDLSNVSDNYQAGDLLDEFVDLIDTVGSGIDYYGNNFLNNIFNLSTDTVQLSPNTNLKNRIGQFRSNLPSYLRQDNNLPTPAPDPDYSSICNKLKGYVDYFTWNNVTYILNYAQLNYKYQLSAGYGPYDLTPNYPFSIFKTAATYWQFMDIGTVYLNSDGNGGYNATYNFPFKACFYNDNNVESNFTRDMAFQNVNNNYVGTVVFNTLSTTDTSIQDLAQSNFDSLSIAMTYLYEHFTHIYLYVDNVLWVIPDLDSGYNIGLGTGTYLIETNRPLEYKFEIPVYVDISDLIDKIQLAIDNKITLDFPYLNDLIVDTNGQQTIAVTVFQEDYTIDDLYIQDYGAMIPLFPLWVEYPISLEHINTVATVGIVDVIPEDIIEVLGIFLIVGMFVFLCHRLME